MGMFDEVSVRCPRCGLSTIVQSKAGPCTLETYDASNAPDEVALDLNGETVWCNTCTKPFTLRAVGRIQLISEIRTQ